MHGFSGEQRVNAKTACVDKLGKAVVNAQKSVMCSTTLPLFRKVKFMDEGVWKKDVERGVRFKFIIVKDQAKNRNSILTQC